MLDAALTAILRRVLLRHQRTLGFNRGRQNFDLERSSALREDGWAAAAPIEGGPPRDGTRDTTFQGRIW